MRDDDATSRAMYRSGAGVVIGMAVGCTGAVLLFVLPVGLALAVAGVGMVTLTASAVLFLRAVITGAS